MRTVCFGGVYHRVAHLIGDTIGHNLGISERILPTKIFIQRESSLTLPETNKSHLEMDGWKMNFPFGDGWQVRTVFRECKS